MSSISPISFRTLIRRIASIIREGQQVGVFRSQVDADECAQLFVMMIEGGILLSNTFRNQKYLELALEQIEKMIGTEIKC